MLSVSLLVSRGLFENGSLLDLDKCLQSDVKKINKFESIKTVLFWEIEPPPLLSGHCLCADVEMTALSIRPSLSLCLFGAASPGAVCRGSQHIGSMFTVVSGSVCLPECACLPR